MSFDECTDYPATEAEASSSMRLSMRWARRGWQSHVALCKKGTPTPQGTPTAPCRACCLASSKGGMYPHLRAESLSELADIGFEGYAIGGLSVGEPKEEMNAIVDQVAPTLPADKPRYLMGVGTPEDLVRGVRSGVDMFDCVLPTRNARNGHLFTSSGVVRIRNARYRNRPRSPRRALRLLHLCELLPGVSAPPRPVWRDPRRRADDDPQLELLPGTDGAIARCHRSGYIGGPCSNALSLPARGNSNR